MEAREHDHEASRGYSRRDPFEAIRYTISRTRCFLGALETDSLPRLPARIGLPDALAALRRIYHTVPERRKTTFIQPATPSGAHLFPATPASARSDAVPLPERTHHDPDLGLSPQPRPLRLSSQFGRVSPCAASPSSHTSPLPRRNPPPKGRQTDTAGNTIAQSLREGLQQEGSGTGEDGDSYDELIFDLGKLAEYSLPAEDGQGEESHGDEQERSSVGVSPIGLRQRDVKGKARAPLDSLDNRSLLSTSTRAHHPRGLSSLRAVVPTDRPNAFSSPNSLVSTSSFSSTSLTDSSWSSNALDTSTIKHSRYQRPEADYGLPKTELLYAKLGQKGGVFAHFPWLLVLTKDERRGLIQLCKKFKVHTSAEDRLRLKVLAKEVGSGRVSQSRNCRSRRFACALCDYLKGYGKKGFPIGFARQTVCE